MGEIQPRNLYTRRAALTIAAAAIPLSGQTRKSDPPKGEKMGHPVVYFEIGCRDRAKTEQFFGDLFGWKMQPAGLASDIDTGGPGGIPGHITALGHEPFHYTMFYVQVDDVKASLDKAVSLGGKVVVPAIKIPTGTFAWFSDPEGNIIGLINPAK